MFNQKDSPMKHHPLLTTVAMLAMSLPSAAFAASSQDFVKNATIGNLFEVESSKVALDKTTNKDVHDFAERMVKDHGQASEDLEAALKHSELDMEAPSQLDSKHQKKLAELKKASGKTFDAKYIKAQKEAHKEAVRLFQTYAKSGDNDDLKQFASDTLPTLESHEEEINDIAKSR